MTNRDRGRGERSRSISARSKLMAGCLAALAATGCAPRSMTITQDDYVNTDMHRDRPPDARTGEPLELTLVCVYPDDLDRKDNANDRLAPGSKITCRDWYTHRPLPEDRPDSEESHDRFRLNKNQIYLLTNETQFYGKKIGPALRGGVEDGKRIERSGFVFSSLALHDKRAAIYVFPKFTDKAGKVLPEPPSVFDPPGAYTDELSIHIGVSDPKSTNPKQYIKNTTERKLHKKPE